MTSTRRHHEGDEHEQAEEEPDVVNPQALLEEAGRLRASGESADSSIKITVILNRPSAAPAMCSVGLSTAVSSLETSQKAHLTSIVSLGKLLSEPTAVSAGLPANITGVLTEFESRNRRVRAALKSSRLTSQCMLCSFTHCFSVFVWNSRSLSSMPHNRGR